MGSQPETSSLGWCPFRRSTSWTDCQDCPQGGTGEREGADAAFGLSSDLLLESPLLPVYSLPTSLQCVNTFLSGDGRIKSCLGHNECSGVGGGDVGRQQLCFDPREPAFWFLWKFHSHSSQSTESNPFLTRRLSFTTLKIDGVIHSSPSLSDCLKKSGHSWGQLRKVLEGTQRNMLT